MNQNENMKGTTTIGFVCTDGVVLATETRATMGSLIANKAVNKLYQLDDKIGATIAGTVSHAQSLMDLLKAEISLYKLKNDKDMSMESLAVLTSNILKSGPYMVQTIQVEATLKIHAHQQDQDHHSHLGYLKIDTMKI